MCHSHLHMPKRRSESKWPSYETIRLYNGQKFLTSASSDGKNHCKLTELKEMTLRK